MGNVVRWMVFTVAVAAVGLALALGMLMLGRLYAGLQDQAFVFVLLVFYSIGVTMAAIQFAGKLEDEERRALDGGHPPLPPRSVARRDTPDI